MIGLVTVPLFLRVSEILPPARHFFPPNLYSLLKISPCSPGSRWMVFGLGRVKVSVQLVSKISNLCGPDA